MAFFHNGLLILMLGCFLPVAESSSPFLSPEVRQEERDAAERAIRDQAEDENNDVGQVVAPPPANPAQTEVMMPPEMGRETKQQEEAEYNPWTAESAEDDAYEEAWEKKFPDPKSVVAADETEKLAQKAEAQEKRKERPDFMSKIMDHGRNWEAAVERADAADAKANAAVETLNGDTTMEGINNADIAEDNARKNHDDEFHGGHDRFPTDTANDMSQYEAMKQNLALISS